MRYVSEFEKVSYEQFKKDFLSKFSINEGNDEEGVIRKIYDEIVQIPKRATTGSAGYDFISPVNFTIAKGVEVVIPTGIRCKIDEDWFLGIYPRSSLGFKYRVALLNTVGIIDSDYYYTDNEGHIMVKLTADHEVTINAGERFCQGIFTPYGIAVNDDATAKRTGGFGSSGK